MNFQLIAEQSDECNLAAYESGLLFEECNIPSTYEDDFWFAGFCLSTSFPSSQKDYQREFHIGGFNLYIDLLIHSVDSTVGF